MSDTHRNFEPLLASQAPTLSEEAPRGEHYLPPGHVQLLEKLEHLSRYSHFIQIVEAVPGAGKTTLARQFFPDPDDNSVHACFITAPEGMDASQLLAELVEQLHLDVAVSAGDEDRLQAVLEHAELLCDISRLFLIVVDDADNLTNDALDLLLNQLLVISNADARPHLVFFATPKLRETLEQPQFQPVLDSSCHFVALEPLDAAALDAFVHHRFPSVYPRLSEKQLKRLHNESFGLPGRVPRVMQAILGGEKSPRPAKKRPQLRLRLPGRRFLTTLALLAAALLVTAAGVGWLLYPTDSTDRLQLALPVPVQEDPPQTEDEPEPAPLSLEEKLAQAEAELAAAQAEAAAEAEAKAQFEPPAPAEAQPPAPEEKPPAAAVDQLPTAPVRPQPEPETAPAEVAEAPVDESPKKKRVLTLPDTAPAPAAPARTEEKGFLREQELLSWKPSGYTLQVLGARKEESVIDFISTHHNNENLYYFSTIFKGKPWYVVVYGQYRTRDLAMAAIPELPPELRQRRPWARSVKGVQNDIRRKE